MGGDQLASLFPRTTLVRSLRVVPEAQAETLTSEVSFELQLGFDEFELLRRTPLFRSGLSLGVLDKLVDPAGYGIG